MANDKKNKKAKQKPKKKQRRSFLDRIDKIAAAIYWVVKTIILIIEWWLAR